MLDLPALPRSLFGLAGALLAMLWSVAAPAQTIDLSLNVYYTAPSNTTSGGTWELVAKSSHSGLSGLSAHIKDISGSPIVNEAPRATFSGGPAGFSIFASPVFGEGRNITVAQAPNAAGQPQGLFYGVGTLTNGSPNYPGKDPSWNSFPGSPSFSFLTNVQDIPWAPVPLPPPGNTLPDSNNWLTAARLASGTFAAGVTPSFFTGSEGNVFLTVGTSTTAGTISDPGVANVTTIVRSNFVQFAGDYSQNGKVDAADYIVWRKTLGQLVPLGTGADGNNNGIVDPGDHTFWRSRFGLPGAGAGMGDGSGSNLSGSAVPEPTTIVALIIGATYVLTCRRVRS
jgi:hypothetical protein